MIYKLKKIGTELYLHLSDDVLKEIGISEKTDIEMMTSDGSLVIRPKRDIVPYEKRQADIEKITDYLLRKYGPLLAPLTKC